MDFNQWDKIFSSISSQSNSSNSNIISRVKKGLKEQDKSVHKKWYQNQCEVNHLFIVTLISHQIDVKISLLHIAAYTGYLKIVKYLIDEKGVEPCVKNDDGRTPLHFAALNGRLDIVQYLADKVDPGVRSRSGNTPLHDAADGGKLEVIKYLVDKKKD